MRAEIIKRIGYVAIGLFIVVVASGCVGQKPQQVVPGETPGVIPTGTEEPAPQQVGGVKESDIASGENDLSQLDSLVNDMNMGSNITIEGDLPSS